MELAKIIFTILLGSLLSANSLKVASWNVENLFDMQLNNTEYKEYIPNTHNWTQQKFQKKLTHLAEVICDLDADIIALQEVENDNALKHLQDTLKKSRCPYRYRAITSKPNTPIHNALLSRVKIATKSDITILGDAKYRSILKVKLQTNPPLYIFVNHWKSLKAPESRRIIYAKALIKALKRLPKGSEYILLGDFNSNWNQYQKMDKFLNDTNGTSAINHILKTTINNHTLRCSDLKKYKREYIHCNLWMELSQSNRWSYNLFGHKSALDAILIPPSLLDGKGWDYKLGSFRVFKPKYLLDKYGYIRRWQIKNHKHIGRGYSDHLPIYALFENKSSLIYRLSHILDKAKLDTKKDIKTLTIDQLLKKFKNKTITYPVILKSVVVIAKQDKMATILQQDTKKAIIIYGDSYLLKEGRVYDLMIFKLKNYKGMPEITDFEILKDKGYKDIDSLIPKFKPYMFSTKYLSRFVKDIKGVYRDGYINIDGKIYPIYFKNRKKIPPNGSFIKIKRVQIGYYINKFEFVVWSPKDYIKE